MVSMKSVTIAAALAALAGSAAHAGTPLVDPPFSGGGFLPPDKNALKQEEHVNKLIGKYAAKRTKCDRSAVTSLQLAYTPANPSKIADVQALWTACVANVDLYYTTLRDKLILKGTPPCLDQAGIDALRGLMDAERTAINTIVYCDAGGASPDPATGLNIPDMKQETIGETQAAHVVRKAGLYGVKCYSKAASYALKLGAALPSEVVSKIQGCLQKGSDSASAAIDKLDQTQKLPSCLPPATAANAVNTALATSAANTAGIYCGSPSGAFVDGASTF